MSAVQIPRLVLFDLDNTLICGDSDYAWAEYLIDLGVLERDHYRARNAEFYRAYREGRLDIQAFLKFQLAPLARHGRAQLEDWRNRFVRDRILPLIPPAARDLVRTHSSYLCAIITATNDFVTTPIAEEFGVANLIATQAEQMDGAFTGGVEGVPCFGEGKVTRLEQWLAQHRLAWENLGETWFFSDSFNDLPLLMRVSHPVAVDPDATLHSHAQQHGWPIISLCT
ncbi:MAG: HAD family hydrolase [Burkholderiales bacterium]